MLTAGARVGSYEIVSALGAGGMGEVYRARDPRLRRDVALKVLPDAVAGDADRLARFAREAYILASLNHPNIAAVYGFEDSAPVRALVLELIDGETLAERIARGPLTLKDALCIACAVADALGAAHDKGVIHRDLKPANVMLTRQEVVKVLDFGVAKATHEVGGPDAATTLADIRTGAGTTPGTPAYMSPEQTRGQPLDNRADIWALGCVLFEMLSGRRAFAGATVSDTIVRVLDHDPDWRLLPATIPVRLRQLLRRCLEKEPGKRWRDAADLGFELSDLQQAAAPGNEDGETARGRRLSWGERLAWMSIVGAVAAAAAGVVLWRQGPVPAQPITFSVGPPPGTTFSFDAGAPWPSVSPDGRQLAFVALSDTGEQQLWLRALDQADARPVRGTGGAYRPFWSPDSRSLAFFNDGRLWRIDLPDGTPYALAVTPYSGGLKGTWGRDAVIVQMMSAFYRVPSTGGPVTLLDDGTRPGRERSVLENVSFLPDGRRYLYLINDPNLNKKELCVGSIDPRPHACELPLDVQALYAEPGFLVFVQDGVLRTQRFDSDRLTLSGQALPVSDTRMARRETWNALPFSVSSTGVLAYHANTGEVQLVWFDRAGERLGVVDAGDALGLTDVSDDGRRILFRHSSAVDGGTDLWLHDIERRRSAPLPVNPNAAGRGVFSPDGDKAAFRGTRDGVNALYVAPLSGVGSATLIAPVDDTAAPLDWSSDGRFILYQSVDPSTGWDIWAAPVSGGGSPVAVAHTEHGEREGRFSPDGHWVAYDSSETGRREIWVQPFPPNGDRWQASTTGGFSPRWRQDGRELFYVAADGMLMAIPTALGPTPEFGKAVPLFRTMLRETRYGGYAAVADGKRFLITMPPDGHDATPITVVVNWTQTLRR